MNITVLELGEDLVRISCRPGTYIHECIKSRDPNHPAVDVANYVIEFQFSDPVLTVTTHNKADPVKAVLDACRRLSGNCDELLSSLEIYKKIGSGFFCKDNRT